ncbi:MAG: hypothetical protein MZV70_30030 [Desulfobacterales bacterium]|nr:hypothetical protein [Desulfobacterales bacterium]
MKKTMVVLGLVGVMALTAATAFAWGPGGGRGMGMGYGPGQGYRQGPAVTAPTLSAEQVAQDPEAPGPTGIAEAAKVRTEMVTKRTGACRPSSASRSLDQAKIAAKQKELTTLQAQMQEKALATRTAARRGPHPRAAGADAGVRRRAWGRARPGRDGDGPRVPDGLRAAVVGARVPGGAPVPPGTLSCPEAVRGVGMMWQAAVGMDETGGRHGHGQRKRRGAHRLLHPPLPRDAVLHPV